MNESWEYYDDIAHLYDSQYEEPYWTLYHEVLHRLVDSAVESHGRVLDLGTGTGRWALHFAALGNEVVAVDRSEEMLAVLKKKADEFDVDVKTVCCEAEELPFDNDTFDCVVAMGDVTSYSRNHHKMIAEVFRVLRSPGTFLLTVDSAYAFLHDFLSHAELERAKRFLNNKREVRIGDSQMSRKSFRTHPFFPDELSSSLEEAGFSVVDRAGLVVMGPYVESKLARRLYAVAEWEYKLCREKELLGRAEHLFFSCKKG